MPLTLKNFYKQGWQPGANTIAYYPFNSDFSDSTGNSSAATTYGTVSITNFNDVACAYFNNGYLKYTNNELPQSSSERSILLRCYISTVDGSAWLFDYGGTGGAGNQSAVYYSNDSSVHFSPYMNDVIVPENILNGWHLICVTTDTSSNVNIYCDGVLSGSGQSSINTSGYNLYLGKLGWVYSNSSQFYLSNVIVENKIRTAQEVSDYYNQTKSLYGIS